MYDGRRYFPECNEEPEVGTDMYQSLSESGTEMSPSEQEVSTNNLLEQGHDNEESEMGTHQLLSDSGAKASPSEQEVSPRTSNLLEQEHDKEQNY